jgi:hypothetical protein
MIRSAATAAKARPTMPPTEAPAMILVLLGDGAGAGLSVEAVEAVGMDAEDLDVVSVDIGSTVVVMKRAAALAAQSVSK